MKYQHYLTILLAVALGACQGGSSSTSGSGGAVTGVQMPSNMSVVSAQGGSQPAGVLINYNAVAGVLFSDSGTDYTNDVVRTWVWDDSLEPLQMVNEILCYMGQTAADEMVNVNGDGVYTALIDEEKCRQGQDTSSDTGQSSGQSTELNLWTVRSTRNSNSAPQIVHLWVPPSNEPGDNESILVEVTAYAGVSTSAPFGSFKMNFKGVDPQGATTMTGSLFTVDSNTDSSVTTTGNPQFKLIISGDDSGGGGGPSGTFSMKTNVLYNDGTGDSGVARTSTGFTPTGQSVSFGNDFSIAFNNTHFLRQGDIFNETTQQIDTAQVCTDRNDFNTNVWRYNLYYSGNNLPTGKTVGQRVKVNSGFPIVVTGDFDNNGSDETEHGWMGYWGLWLPDTVDTTTLSTVTQESFGSGASTVYDLVQAPGKLIKSTKSTIPLTDLDGVTFNFWDNSVFEEFVVEYTADGTLTDSTNVGAAGFYKTLRYVFTQNGRETSTDLNNDTVTGDAPVDVTPTTGQWLGMWSQALGGNINYVGGDTNVTYFQEEFVNTGTAIASLFDTTNDPDQDGIVTFDCYNNCLRSGITQTQLDGNDIFLPDAANTSAPAVTYYFRRSDLTLYDGDPTAGGQAVTLATGVTPSQGSFNEWGMQTNAMVMAGTVLTDIWDAWNQTVSYRWETGHNTWNKAFAVKAQGTNSFVSFEPPLQIPYQFTAADDANAGGASAGTAHYNKTFLLEYGGQGDLWGIPMQQQGNRWASAFTIADGALMGSGDMYVVKAIEKEQTMRSVALSNCATLALPNDSSLPLPTSSDIGAVTLTLAGKPTVTVAPAVIEGEVQ